MSRKLSTIASVALVAGAPAAAEVPNVAVDIAPVHSLVARVMQGVGTPELILPPGASPHEYSLRPSEAAALQDADVVFWMGADLAPWMAGALETLSGDAAVTALLESKETTLLGFREGALFEAHDHDHGDDDHEDHAEAEHDHDDHDHEDHAEAEHDHDDHDHEEHAEAEHGHDDHDHEEHAEAEHGHDDHEHEEHAHAGHDHGAHDPHAWLSPSNASAWLDLIAAELAAADPDNAAAYAANATEARTEIEAMMADVTAILEPVRGGSFVVFHDAYQYFETDFDFRASGAISLADAADPSPARIAEIQGRVREEGVDCVLAEPQFNPGLVATVLDGTDAKTAVIDPIGVDLEPGPELYPQLIRNMATTLAECL